MRKINEDELKELFIEIKLNNKIAFDRLYNQYSRLVYGISFSILKNSQDAEDMVQNVFAKIYTTEKNKLPVKSEATWLYSVTKNATINFLKRKNSKIRIEDIYEIEDNSEINKIIDQDSYNRLISKLDDDEKEIVSLKILGDFSFDEIGQILNKPTGTIKWKYYKSINTLKLLLSNLSMFVVTFISSIIAFKNRKKSSKPIDVEDKQEIENSKNEENVAGTPPKEEHREQNDIFADEEKQEIVIVEPPVVESNANYIGIGLLSISSIFFMMTMIFLIIFAKHQLKRKKKVSK